MFNFYNEYIANNRALIERKLELQFVYFDLLKAVDTKREREKSRCSIFITININLLVYL